MLLLQKLYLLNPLHTCHVPNNDFLSFSISSLFFSSMHLEHQSEAKICYCYKMKFSMKLRIGNHKQFRKSVKHHSQLRTLKKESFQTTGMINGLEVLYSWNIIRRVS